MRLYHTNALFWMLAFMGWFWVSLHRSHILSFVQGKSSLYIDICLHYEYVIQHYAYIIQYWGLLALVMTVYCFGTRRISESIPKQMARFPGTIAVTIVFIVLSNGISGVISGAIHGSLVFSSAVIVAFISFYSASCIISKGNLDAIITEGAGVIAGLLLGVCLNAKMYGYVVGFAGGAVSFTALGISKAIANANGTGSVWKGRAAYMASLISWMIISGFALQDSVTTPLGYF